MFFVVAENKVYNITFIPDYCWEWVWGHEIVIKTWKDCNDPGQYYLVSACSAHCKYHSVMNWPTVKWEGQMGRVRKCKFWAERCQSVCNPLSSLAAQLSKHLQPSQKFLRANQIPHRGWKIFTGDAPSSVFQDIPDIVEQLLAKNRRYTPQVRWVLCSLLCYARSSTAIDVLAPECSRIVDLIEEHVKILLLCLVCIQIIESYEEHCANWLLSWPLSRHILNDQSLQHG